LSVKIALACSSNEQPRSIEIERGSAHRTPTPEDKVGSSNQSHHRKTDIFCLMIKRCKTSRRKVINKPLACRLTSPEETYGPIVSAMQSPFSKLALVSFQGPKVFFLSNPQTSRPRSRVRIYTLCTQISASSSRYSLVISFSRSDFLGSSSRSRHAVTGLLMHRMLHPGRPRHVLLHLWTGTGTAIELLPFCVAHIGWPTRNV